jgi:hypothetical protein
LFLKGAQGTKPLDLGLRLLLSGHLSLGKAPLNSVGHQLWAVEAQQVDVEISGWRQGDETSGVLLLANLHTQVIPKGVEHAMSAQ